MPEWVAPVLAAAIAAGAVVITNIINTRNSRVQRLDEQKARAEDRAHERARWHLENDEAKRKWLLDRRAEAYTNLLEYRYRDADDPLVTKLRTTIYVPLYMYGSKAVRVALDRYDEEDWNSDVGPNPWWAEVMDAVRDDLGNPDAADLDAKGRHRSQEPAD